MELALGEPKARWRVKHRHLHADVTAEPAVPQEVSCSVTLHEGNAAPNWLPFRLHLELPPKATSAGDQTPQDDAHAKTSASDTDATSLLQQPFVSEQRVVFRVFSRRDESVQDTLLSEHTRTLRDCVPLLTEGQIEWTDQIEWHEMPLELRVTIPVKTDRKPRKLVRRVLIYKKLANKLGEQLVLHKKVVALGLTPPILGCFLGVAVTSPVWVPLTLVLGVLGFPLWVVLGVGLSFVTVASTVSTVVAIQIARSQRVKRHVNDFLLGPHGQMLLFKSNAVDGRVQSLAAQMSELASQYVMDDKSRKLLASLVIDFVGNATFALPLIGELADWVWAPISASLVSTLYSDSSPHLKYVAFIEEWLPFTDFIPTATIGWLTENGLPIRQLLSSLRF
uniref:Uncharacterized protein n=1 Tax=Globisporangium ultimum (strain ATCC 200006 / CBS 805.95 / DAOM BR144) TaxID=431595 RepID=K3XBS1_GLOUD